MKPVILLIDLQNDFLRSSLEPASGRVVSGATRLLDGGRRVSVPVVHVWTTVTAEDDRRMPHWKGMDKWACVEGTEGHATPEPLSPLPSENIIHKTFFSAFSCSALDGILKSLDADTLLLAGVHLHGCIRTTALDAYQRGFNVWIAEDAVGSDDPLHAAITRRYLENRGMRFVSVNSILSSFGNDTPCGAGDGDVLFSLPAAIIAGSSVPGDGLESMMHVSPRQSSEKLWRMPVCGPEHVSRAAGSAKEAWPRWKGTGVSSRGEVVERFADLLQRESSSLAKQMAVEIGKPVTQSQAELARTVALLKAAIYYANLPLEKRCGADSAVRYPSVGVVSVITPWNNPLAIPFGKIAPALLFGNTVVWKPAPGGSSLAVRAMELLRAAECPAGVVNLVCGDRSTAMTLMADSAIDAVTLSGSPGAGYSAQDICTTRHIPLQAELGGNNAAVVWRDCDVEEAALKVAEAAFGFAGQRCTANRRVVVDALVYEQFLHHFESAVARLVWNDPLDDATQVGPLISLDARSRVEALVERVTKDVERVLAPHRSTPAYAELTRRGAYYPPTIVCCDSPEHEVVQEETFGPLAVVQRAHDSDHAMRLCNGVRQGLVAALFSRSGEIQKKFMEEARAGILKINAGTSDANAEAPFGGWKASGVGPPEHGASDREFYARTQSVYHRGDW